jgi:hypothetical protein
MPMRPFLADRAFMPEQIAEMSAALESVCNTLNLDRGADDSRTRLVAKTIIAFAQRGVRDPAALAAAALKEFKAD